MAIRSALGPVDWGLALDAVPPDELGAAQARRAEAITKGSKAARQLRMVGLLIRIHRCPGIGEWTLRHPQIHAQFGHFDAHVPRVENRRPDLFGQYLWIEE